MTIRKRPTTDKGKQVASLATRTKKRRVAAQSRQLDNQSVDFDTEEEMERFNTFFTRKFIKNKFLDWGVLQHIQMEAEIKELVEVGAWNKFFNIKEDTYEALTAELMATYWLTIEGKDWVNATVQFQLLGKKHTMSITDFSVIMGLYESDFTEENEYFALNLDMGTKSAGRQSFWHMISASTQPYDPGCSKASTLRTLGLRYIHAVLSHSITGRGSSTGVVNKIDLTFLWSMVEKKPIHIGYWLAMIFHHQSRDPRVGTVAIGPYVTQLLKGLSSFHLQRTSKPRPTEPLGFDTLLAMKMVTCQKTPAGLKYFLIMDESVQQPVITCAQPSTHTEQASVPSENQPFGQTEQEKTSTVVERDNASIYRDIDWMKSVLVQICQHFGIQIPHPPPDPVQPHTIGQEEQPHVDPAHSDKVVHVDQSTDVVSNGQGPVNASSTD